MWLIWNTVSALPVWRYLHIVKFQNFQTPENSAAIYLKFKQRGQTLQYFIKKDANETANKDDTDQTAPRREEQSDQGLHCLQRPVCPKTWIIRVIQIYIPFNLFLISSDMSLDHSCISSALYDLSPMRSINTLWITSLTMMGRNLKNVKQFPLNIYILED